MCSLATLATWVQSSSDGSCHTAPMFRDLCWSATPLVVINDAVDSSRFDIRSDVEPPRQICLVSDRTADAVARDCDGPSGISVYARESWWPDTEEDTSARCRAASEQLGSSTCHARSRPPGKTVTERGASASPSTTISISVTLTVISFQAIYTA
jgi:hypothetical protein